MTYRATHTLLLSALCMGLLFGCNTKSHIGGDDTGTDGDADGGADGSTDGGSGEACGPVTCGEGLVCCNASCGICTEPGLGCPAIACVDAGPPTCGGFTGAECPGGFYCDFPEGCGFADGTGVCEPEPEGCLEDCPGVCGCDGLDYCNECIAASAGVDTLHRGPCDSRPPPLPGACGGRSGVDCGPDAFCDFPEGALCDFADGTGVCTLRPTVCTEEFAPVCGCDGVTYGNACDAHASGTDYSAPGECEGTPGSEPGSGG